MRDQYYWRFPLKFEWEKVAAGMSKGLDFVRNSLGPCAYFPLKVEIIAIACDWGVKVAMPELAEKSIAKFAELLHYLQHSFN